jgi:deoxyxylulose-5-phosphate synthase
MGVKKYYVYFATKLNKPIAIRYPRGKGFIVNWQNEMETIEIGKGETIYKGERYCYSFSWNNRKQCKTSSRRNKERDR